MFLFAGKPVNKNTELQLLEKVIINKAEFTANGEVFDVGGATYKALKTGCPQRDEKSNGNGALMRVLPLAFVDCTDDEVREVSDITHGHWIAKKGMCHICKYDKEVFKSGLYSRKLAQA